MIKKIIYIATDGKEFATENECQTYENVTNNLFDGFTFFDSERDIIDKNQSISTLLNEAKYFYINPNLSAEKLIFNLERIQKYDFLSNDFKRVPIKLLYGLWFWTDEWQSYNVLKTHYDDLEKEFRIKIANT